MPVFDIEDLVMSDRDKYNFHAINNRLRVLLESVCDLVLYIERLQSRRYDKNNGLQLPKIKLSPDLSKSNQIYVFDFVESPDSSEIFTDIFKGTSYETVALYLLEEIQRCGRDEILAIPPRSENEMETRFSLVTINFFTYAKPGIDSNIKRFRMAVSLNFKLNNQSRNVYSEYWEEFGWTVVKAKTEKGYLNPRLNPNSVNEKNVFFIPSRYLDLRYNEESKQFDLVNVSSSETNNGRVRVVNCMQGYTFFARLMSGYSENNEMKDVFYPKAFLDYNKAITDGIISNNYEVTFDPNNLDCFICVKKLRVVNNSLNRLLLSLYTGKFYDYFIKGLIPSRFQLEGWKFCSTPTKIDYSTYVKGVDYIVELEYLFSMAEDRLDLLGVGSCDLVKEARIAYEWFLCGNWKFNYNDHMQAMKEIVTNKEIKFNEQTINISLNLNAIESLGYFIGSCQRYLVLVYMKFLTEMSKRQCNISLSFILSFSAKVINAFKFFVNSNEKELFLKGRDVRFIGSSKKTLINGLFNDVLILNDSEIYLQWLKVAGIDSNSCWDGRYISYPDIEVLKCYEKSDSNEKKSNIYKGDILEFLFGDFIRVSGNIMKEFCNLDFPELIRRVDFSEICKIATDTRNHNHKRLCIELCKYFSLFYGNKLILEQD